MTARALALYDPELPKGIAEAWGVPNVVRAMPDDDSEDANVAAALSGTNKALQRETEACRKRIGDIEAELGRRAGGGTPSDHTWNEWVGKSPPG